MSIGAMCNREVVVAQMTESLHTAVEFMHALGVGTIAVCEEYRQSEEVKGAIERLRRHAVRRAPVVDAQAA